MSAALQPPPRGHNSGGVDIALLLDPAILTDQWELTYAKEVAQRDELLAGVERMKEKFKDGLKTDADAEDVIDFANQLRDTAKIGETLHTKEKAPYRAAGLAADAFFKHGLEDALLEHIPYFTGNGTRGQPLGLLTRYQRDKVERERLERVEKARLAQEEADRAAAAAERTVSLDVVDHALQAQQQAEAAQAAAKAPAIELSRLRGTRSGAASLRDNWVFEVTNLTELLQAVIDGKVAPNLVVVNDSVVNALIRGKHGIREIPGLRIYNAPKTGF